METISDVSDIDLLKLIGKPVIVGVYSRSDDSLIVQGIGVLEVVLSKPDEIFYLFESASKSFVQVDPEKAYVLISYRG